MHIYTNITLSMFIQGNATDEIEHYGNFTIQRDATLPRELYITNMSTLVSNSKYLFQVFIVLYKEGYSVSSI